MIPCPCPPTVSRERQGCITGIFSPNHIASSWAISSCLLIEGLVCVSISSLGKLPEINLGRKEFSLRYEVSVHHWPAPGLLALWQGRGITAEEEHGGEKLVICCSSGIEEVRKDIPSAASPKWPCSCHGASSSSFTNIAICL